MREENECANRKLEPRMVHTPRIKHLWHSDAVGFTPRVLTICPNIARTRVERYSVHSEPFASIKYLPTTVDPQAIPGR